MPADSTTIFTGCHNSRAVATTAYLPLGFVSPVAGGAERLSCRCPNLDGGALAALAADGGMFGAITTLAQSTAVDDMNQHPLSSTPKTTRRSHRPGTGGFELCDQARHDRGHPAAGDERIGISFEVGVKTPSLRAIRRSFGDGGQDSGLPERIVRSDDDGNNLSRQRFEFLADELVTAAPIANRKAGGVACRDPTLASAPCAFLLVKMRVAGAAHVPAEFAHAPAR